MAAVAQKCELALRTLHLLNVILSAKDQTEPISSHYEAALSV